jgi:hypothetical protein
VGREAGGEVSYRSPPRTYRLPIGDVALVVIAVFVVLAYFHGWG